jgi:hypothetical protein
LAINFAAIFEVEILRPLLGSSVNKA